MSTTPADTDNTTDPFTVSNDVTCPACATARAAGAMYCPQCGTALVRRRDQEEGGHPDPVVVPTGPGSVPAEVNVEDEFTNSLREGPDQKPDAERAPEPQPSISNHGPACPHCGRAVDADVRPTLRLVGVGDQRPTVTLGDEPLVIGKDDTCGLVIGDDEYLSRRHARISRDGDLCYLEDLGSSNGTLLKIRRPIIIEPGDEIIIGSTVLRLETSSGS